MRVEVWSEKGTVSGVLDPVICSTYVPLRIFHGFTSASSIHSAANDSPGDDRTTARASTLATSTPAACSCRSRSPAAARIATVATTSP